jgi:hypothetical protein
MAGNIGQSERGAAANMAFWGGRAIPESDRQFGCCSGFRLRLPLNSLAVERLKQAELLKKEEIEQNKILESDKAKTL